MNILVGLLRFFSVIHFIPCVVFAFSLLLSCIAPDTAAVSTLPSLSAMLISLPLAIQFWRSANGVAVFQRNASQRDREIESMHDEIRTLQNEIAFLQGLNGGAQANRASRQSRRAPAPQQDDEEE